MMRENQEGMVYCWLTNLGIIYTKKMDVGFLGRTEQDITKTSSFH